MGLRNDSLSWTVQAVDPAVSAMPLARLSDATFEPITVAVNKAGTVANVTIPIYGDGTDKASNASLKVLRNTIIPALFLELTYHLEHHLYPEVPSHSLPALSRRLDPLLRQAGVRPRRVP